MATKKNVNAKGGKWTLSSYLKRGLNPPARLKRQYENYLRRQPVVPASKVEADENEWVKNTRFRSPTKDEMSLIFGREKNEHKSPYEPFDKDEPVKGSGAFDAYNRTYSDASVLDRSIDEMEKSVCRICGTNPSEIISDHTGSTATLTQRFETIGYMIRRATTRIDELTEALEKELGTAS